MADPRKHHWVPQFYLRSFSDRNNPERIYGIGKDSGKIIPMNIQNAAAQRDLYAYTPESGVKDTKSTEENIAKLETIISPVLKRIHQREPIDEEIKIGIAMFVGLQMTRTPMMRDKASRMVGEMVKQHNQFIASHEDYFKKIFHDMKKETGLETEVTTEELREFSLKGEYDVTPDNEYSMGISLQMLEKVTKIFYSMNWVFFSPTSTEWRFLTCDNPFGLMNPDLLSKEVRPVGLLNEETTIHMPLSPTIYAMGTWNGESRYHDASKKMIRESNVFTIFRSKRFVFSHVADKSIGNFVNKIHDEIRKKK